MIRVLQSHKFSIGSILIVALTVALIAYPVGDFPNNDDWAFSLPIRWWLEGHKLRFTNWQSMNLIGQLILGLAWSKLFGFSYFKLRMFTFALSVCSLLICYAICIFLKFSQKKSLILVGVLTSSPLFWCLSFSFMTDIPYLSICLVSLLFYIRSLYDGKDSSQINFILGTFFLIVGILIRQTAIGVALGYLVADAIVSKGRASRGLFALLVAIATQISILPLIEVYTPLPTIFSDRSEQLLLLLEHAAALKMGVLRVPYFSLLRGSIYLGLLAIPVSFALVANQLKLPISRIIVIAFISLATYLLALFSNISIPLAHTGNIITKEGLGPRLIENAQTSVEPKWWFLTFVCCISLGILLEQFIKSIAAINWRSKEFASSALLLTSALAMYAPFSLSYGLWVDRYMLVPGFLGILAVAAVTLRKLETRSFATTLNLCLILVATIFNSVLVHDFFSWNRARYSMIHLAIEDFYKNPHQIDGGFEFNNLVAVHPHPETAYKMPLADTDTSVLKISKEPIPNWTVLRSKPTGEFLPLGTGRIYLSQVPKLEPQENRITP